MQIRDGKVQLPDGFSLIWVKHRHGRHQATPQIALLEGWGELRGRLPPATPTTRTTSWYSGETPKRWRGPPTG
ncbi:Uncharacterised protein [Raoultella terrigena]|uniref:Uncharacterized protein n=1 Tax=Raoultella terrigena TaxID=577 RepID=A0A4U9CZV0_RAOTE|nr:Uncharacterised protein [Raoultella terrigena]